LYLEHAEDAHEPQHGEAAERVRELDVRDEHDDEVEPVPRVLQVAPRPLALRDRLDHDLEGGGVVGRARRTTTVAAQWWWWWRDDDTRGGRAATVTLDAVTRR
jgi:hypothetical protein